MRASEVVGVVTRGYRLYRTSMVMVSALTTGGALVVLLDPGPGWAPYGSVALGCCVAALLLLAARAVRDALGRGALRLGGGAVALVLCATEVLRAEGPWRGLYAGLAVGLGVVAVVAAVALGRGWRSVRWGRLGDLAEGVALSLALPAALAAAGLLDWIRQLAS